MLYHSIGHVSSFRATTTPRSSLGSGKAASVAAEAQRLEGGSDTSQSQRTHQDLSQDVFEMVLNMSQCSSEGGRECGHAA